MTQRIFTIIAKSLFLLFTGVAASFATLWVLLSAEPVQRYVVNKISELVSDELQAPFRLGKIKITTTNLLLEDVFLGDRNNDTAFYIARLDAYLPGMYIIDNGNEIYVSDVNLQRAIVKFTQHDSGAQFSNQFFFDYIGGPLRDSTEIIVGSPFKLNFDRLKLDNSVFALRMADTSGRGAAFNERNFRVNEVNMNLENFAVVDDSIAFISHHFSAVEKGGFEILALTGCIGIWSQGMCFEDLRLRTPGSLLRDYFRMDYESWDDLGDFVDVVRMTGNLSESYLDMYDLSLFAPEIDMGHTRVEMDGSFAGTVNALRGRNISLKTGESTVFRGQFSINGAANWPNTFADLDIQEGTTHYSDLNNLLGEGLLPDMLVKLGKLKFKGKLTGFLNDFVSYGTYQTDLGSAKSDLHLILKPKIEEVGYKGSLSLFDFEIGKLLDVPALGQITTTAEVDGSGLTLESMQAIVRASASTLTINNYPIKTVVLNGFIDRQNFDGFLSIDDRNLELKLSGNADMRPDSNSFRMNLDVMSLNLSAFTGDSIPFDISFSSHIDVNGNPLKQEVEGYLNFFNLNMHTEGRVLNIPRLSVQSQFTSKQNHFITIESQLFQFRIDGRFGVFDLPDWFQNYAHSLMPAAFKKSDNETDNTDVSFSINAENPEALFNLLQIPLNIKNLNIKGKLNNTGLEMAAGVDQLNYGTMLTRGITANIKPVAAGSMHIIANIDSLKIFDTSFVTNTQLKAAFQNDSFDFEIASGDTNQYLKILTEVNGRIFSAQSGYLAFNKGAVIRNDLIWNISSSSRLNWDSVGFAFQNFSLSDDIGQINLNGHPLGISDNGLMLEAKDFRLNRISPFLEPFTGFQIGGLLNGTLNGFNLNSKPLFTSSIRIDNLSIGLDTLGNLDLKSVRDEQFEIVKIDGSITGGQLSELEIKGFIKPVSSGDNLSININIKPSRLNFIESFLQGIATGIKGTIDGRLRLVGTFSAPEVIGSLNITDASLKLGYLFTDYFFNGKIEFSKDKIAMPLFEARDINGKTAQVRWAINHQNFDNFSLDLKANRLNGVQILNTTRRDNDLFYGVAYASGDVSIRGPFESLIFDLNLTSEKGTVFYMPISSGGGSEYDFISFSEGNYFVDTASYFNLQGFTINFKLNITPDAEVQLVFNEKLGDIMKGRGYAKLDLKILPSGTMQLSGVYEIEEGDYVFTALSSFSKKFIARKGGKIIWTGDPYDATLALEAVYKTQASPKNLVMSTGLPGEGADFSQRTTVECILYLRGPLMKPEISFGLKFPDLSMYSGTSMNALLNAIRRIENDQEELSRQVFFLLTTNNFLTPQENQNIASSGLDNAGSAALSSSVSDFLSNQFNNWLSQIDSRWNVGVNYFAAAGGNQTQLFINVSRKLLDDRLEIDGSYDPYSARGNFAATYMLEKSGNVKLRAFNRINNDFVYNQNVITQGLGIFFRRDFDSGDELLDMWRRGLGMKINRPEPEIGEPKKEDDTSLLMD